ncbi:MAG: hypothetical protein HIU85_04555, partial [Proteobacteria bacterium]|nr:hypothetical protein [Pseudomonadota bacterium]
RSSIKARYRALAKSMSCCAVPDEAKVSDPLVSDAALAAVALAQGATLCSTGKDFRRFTALKLIDPLQTPWH